VPGAHEFLVASGTCDVFRPTNEAGVVSFTAINDRSPQIFPADWAQQIV
jgi:hypothetical protein